MDLLNTPETKMTIRKTCAAEATLALMSPLAAWATNGMQFEGYGPVAAGMGGVAMALDNGVAAAANNPATLGLMSGKARLDLALGHLGPRITSSTDSMSVRSGGTAYEMPAFGYTRRSGDIVYGLAVFAQGGMGTEYNADSFLAMGSGQGVRSELGVGRLIAPLAWKLSQDLMIGGSLDLVWSTLDMKMAISGAQLGQMVTGAGGNLAVALSAVSSAAWARIDFTNGSKFSGEAFSTGWAGKLGFHYQASPELALGGSWHRKTSLRDMKTGDGGAGLSAFGGFKDSGRLTVQDFQMPSQVILGLAWRASPTLTLAADIKRIGWADVMQSFRMRYDSRGMGGGVSFALPQHWKDQTVTAVGLAWQAIPPLTLRAGYNHAANPIPAMYVNPLFPATVKSHYSAGFSAMVGESSEFSATLTKAPASTVTAGSGVTVSHSQLNAQLMFSLRF